MITELGRHVDLSNKIVSYRQLSRLGNCAVQGVLTLLLSRTRKKERKKHQKSGTNDSRTDRKTDEEKDGEKYCFCDFFFLCGSFLMWYIERP